MASDVRPMRLLRIPEPFDHPDWLYEVKCDGFRALAHVNGATYAARRSTGSRKKGARLVGDVALYSLSALIRPVTEGNMKSVVLTRASASRTLDQSFGGTRDPAVGVDAYSQRS